ncbi:MAG: hypothetical protein ACE5I1_04820, partial [bacterium]
GILLYTLEREPQKASAQSWSVDVFQDSLAITTTEDSTNLHAWQLEYTIWPTGADVLLKIALNDTTTKPARYIKVPDGSSLVMPRTASRKIWYKSTSGTGTLNVLGLKRKL